MIYSEISEGECLVRVRPKGAFGYGTVGAANPGECFARAWREIQRRGLTSLLRQDRGYIIEEQGGACFVEFRAKINGANSTALRRLWALDPVEHQLDEETAEEARS